MPAIEDFLYSGCAWRVSRIIHHEGRVTIPISCASPPPKTQPRSIEIDHVRDVKALDRAGIDKYAEFERFEFDPETGRWQIESWGAQIQIQSSGFRIAIYG